MRATMYLTKLALTNFRNYAHLELDLAPGLTLLHGNNAQGKTNLLEAVFYLATARSPHAGAERELIRWGASSEPIPFARVQAQAIRRGDDQVHLEIVLVQASDEKQHPSARVSKRIKVNGVNKRALDLLGQLNVVLFLPEDLDLVFGAPSERRRYLDTTLSQIDSKYGRSLSQYNQVLEQRNALLRDFRDRAFNPFELETWDRKLVEAGAYIVARRARAVADYNRLVADIHARLTEKSMPFAPPAAAGAIQRAKGERLQIVYQPTFPLEGPAPDRQMALGLEPALIPLEGTQAQFHRQLEHMRPRELGAAMTLVGPHRDDLRFFVDGVDMITYASRGQGRTIALSLKMAEMELMRGETGEEPVLLLDDVMSELDKPRRQALSGLLKNASQAIISTTDLDHFTEDVLSRARVVRVIEGRIEENGRTLSQEEPPLALFETPVEAADWPGEGNGGAPDSLDGEASNAMRD
jgi:DNA replication and repair protein RecF